MNHRCQEKNDVRVKKRSTGNQRQTKVQDEFSVEDRSARQILRTFGSHSMSARGNGIALKSVMRSVLRRGFQHSITFNARPVRQVPLWGDGRFFSFADPAPY
jgi:hypothetical protein